MLAGALFAQALADREHRPALLAEAAALMNGLAPELMPLHDMRMWRTFISEAQHKG